MAGGLMQLVAYGAQDVYLTGNPKVTFFQAVYKRHTNFAMENIEQTVNGTAAAGGRVSVTIARNGDLVADMYVEMAAKAGGITPANDAWLAERAVKTVELSVGGQRIDKHYQRWWRLYSELYLDEGKKLSYGKATSATALGEKIFLPLIFFFNRNPGLALPLIALQYHEVRLDFDLSSDFGTKMEGFKVWANYVYLDTEERRRFAQKGHEYLIEQVQHTGTDAVTTATETQKRLSYNHPVKELVFCLETDSVISGGDTWNLTKSTTAKVTSNLKTSVSTTSNVAVAPGAAGAPVNIATGASGVWSEGKDGELDSFKLVLNGQDRMKEQGGKYYNAVQPFVHHSGAPMPGVYAYSFALKPEEHQPTGTCNFSRIDNAQVSIKAKNATAKTLHMFATNYNVLRIQSGMGGLAFSN